MPLNRREAFSATSHLLIATTSARPSCSTRVGDAQILRLEPARRVEQQHDDFGEIDRVERVGDRQLLQLVLHLGALAHARRCRSAAPGAHVAARVGSCHIQSTAIESRVIPASGPVISRSSPSIRLTSVDLPALGRPTIASLSGASGAHRPPSSRHRPRRRLGLDDAAAARRTGRPCPRHARPTAATGSPKPSDSASRMPCLAGAALRPCWRRASPACVEPRSQRAISSSSGTSPARASIMNRRRRPARPPPRSARASGRAATRRPRPRSRRCR